MPVKLKKIGSLEIEEGAEHISSALIFFQRTGLAIMILFIMASLFGFFGPGLLGKTAETNGALTVKYNKFLHLQSSNSMILEINTTQLTQKNHILQVSIDETLLKEASIKSITPKPLIEKAAFKKIDYVFGKTSDTSIIRITFIIEPETFGSRTGIISVENSNPVTLSQYVYP